MVVRKAARVEVRLDDEHERMLREILQRRGITAATLLREKIEEEAVELRVQRVRELFRRADEDPVDLGTPDEIDAELGHGSCPGIEFCGEPEFH